jgi:hypothetical protein
LRPPAEITTYHHALKYLEATEDMANDLIYQMYLVKVTQIDSLFPYCSGYGTDLLHLH